MTYSDEELGLPGNREVVECALHASTTQVLHLAPGTGSRHRTLAERGADAVRGFERVPAVSAGPIVVPDPPATVVAARDGIPADIAEAYLHAKTEVKAILAENLAGVRDSR
ncbi:hypothetical protein [Actinophytocola sp.]|uniref:hypothetical protein n=1 Tax=Actinophytocola sp. TaxID=1872138 RepID=UPI003D6A0707